YPNLPAAVLSPVADAPEPSTLVLLAAGLAILAFWSSRRPAWRNRMLVSVVAFGSAAVCLEAQVCQPMAQSTVSPFGLSGAAGRPAQVAVGDLDNDGIPDVVVANTRTAGLTLLKGNGSGGFTN